MQRKQKKEDGKNKLIHNINNIMGIFDNDIDDKLASKGIDRNELIYVGEYVGGHQNIDNNYKRCVIYARQDRLLINGQDSEFEVPYYIGEIIMNSISNITIEDATTIENKVTLGRLILVGAYAFAWKKKKKNEMAFMSIDWKGDAFDNQTIFSFEGRDALQNANTARDDLIWLINRNKLANQTSEWPGINNNNKKKVYEQDDIQRQIAICQRLLYRGLITQDEFDERINDLKK